jgi:diguanylate cyclase (GGDEF)-like protein
VEASAGCVSKQAMLCEALKVFMSDQLKKRYIQLIQNMLAELAEGCGDQLEGFNQPLMLFVNDIERFSSHKIFDAKFKSFVRSRDDLLLKSVAKTVVAREEEISPEQNDAIDQLLNQVLDLLEEGVSKSADVEGTLDEAIQKIHRAKTINNVRALSQAFIDAGNEMVSINQDMKSDLSKLAVELSYYKTQIENLEGELEATKQEAERDPLTSLRNRRAFTSEIDDAIERASRFQSPMCLMLLDIDHFKQINDKWGHQVGDDVLINFAKLLGRSLRDLDLTYRLGGDEFAVIFSNSNMETAKKAAIRIRDYVSANPYAVKKIRFNMSISGGLVEFKPGENREPFIKRADDQLYRAKNEGRNRVCFG